ncbi:hypothetical protein DSM104299_05581 [Baekduia alba]|uniref:YrdB family protein n=1 Tax=Baekduia alba TaxID=2997333 RepID=UPI00233FAC5E|nr:YrdB family protein [Baekduia alba]WCB96813.1 hypothetical protein DSM104299_05581 [Baekduia alba]
MFTALSGLNLTLRFVVELAAFAALGVWGWHVGGPVPGLALPVAAMVLWGLFAAPKARIAAPDAVRLGTQALVLGGAAVALVAAGAPVAGAVLGIVVAVNSALIAVLPAPSWARA